MESMLQTAIDAVDEASGVCRDIQAQLVTGDTLTKKDRSPVTLADFAAQAVICRRLGARFPDISVVGEEDTGDLRKDENRGLLDKMAGFLSGWRREDILSAIESGTGSPGKSFFTLDPVDGTKGFLRGDQYAIALAMIREGRVVMGVLGCPNLELTGIPHRGVVAWATEGCGAWAQSLSGGEAIRLKVTETDPAAPVRFLQSVESGHADHGRQARIMESFGDRYRSVGIDSQAKYLMLANGGAEVYLRLPSPRTPDYREKIWDHAAGSIIVAEAGGRVTDSKGKPLDFSAGSRLRNNRGVIGTNGRLHSAVLEQIEINPD